MTCKSCDGNEYMNYPCYPCGDCKPPIICPNRINQQNCPFVTPCWIQEQTQNIDE